MTLLPNGTPGIFKAMGLFYPDSYNQSREKEEFAHALFDAAPMPIILVDAETMVIADLNTAAAKLIGAAREEIAGRRREDFIFAERGQSGKGNGNGNPEKTEQILIPAFGRPVAVLNYTVPTVVRGRPHLLEYYVDISERKQAEEKLAVANRELKSQNSQLEAALVEARQSARDLMTANEIRNEYWVNTGHELRTPFNAIIGLSELILDRQFGDLTLLQDKYLREVVKSAENLLILINEILDLSRIEIGELRLESSSVRLNDLFRECLTLVQEKAFRHGVKLRADTDHAPVSITADARKLKQILYNLLIDTVKSTSRGGEVCMRAEVSEKDLSIQVESTGGKGRDGWASPCQKADRPENCAGRTRAVEVANELIRKLVRLHGGEILTDDGTEGNPTTFRISIPLGNGDIFQSEPVNEAR